jgi:glutaredoxin 3
MVSADRRIAARGRLPHSDGMESKPRIVVYSRRMCIWCWKVKRLLSRRRLTFEVRDASSDETRAWLVARTGKRTVPQVFVDDEIVGGFEATRAWLAQSTFGSRDARDSA